MAAQASQPEWDGQCIACGALPSDVTVDQLATQAYGAVGRSTAAEHGGVGADGPQILCTGCCKLYTNFLARTSPSKHNYYKCVGWERQGAGVNDYGRPDIIYQGLGPIHDCLETGCNHCRIRVLQLLLLLRAFGHGVPPPLLPDGVATAGNEHGALYGGPNTETFCDPAVCRQQLPRRFLAMEQRFGRHG